MRHVPETVTEVLDDLLAAQRLFFRALGIKPEQADRIVDLRHVRWNGDHGVSWWEDENGRRHEARGRDFVSRDGLFLYHAECRGVWAWYVFDSSREDATLEY